MKLSLLSLAAGVCAFPLSDLYNGDVPNRLIKLGPNEFQFVSENTKLEYKRNNKKFIDVTSKITIEDAQNRKFVQVNEVPILDRLLLLGAPQLTEVSVPKVYGYPTEIKHKDKVDSYISQIDGDNMYNNLAKFTSFYTRYYKSKTGLESAEWLESKLLEITGETDATVTRVKHDGWDQFSLVASIPGETDTKVVIGAHQDSLNLLLPSLRAPGADDDGSGTVTILEVFRILMKDYKEGGFKPHHTLEFHFYSAEEGGLLGSYDVFKNYEAANETVIALLQQDMTGFTGYEGEEHMGLIEDYTTPGLNEFIKMIVNNYCLIPYHSTTCGYACSDHASAIEHGFPASFVIESEMKLTNKFIHSPLDTIDRIDWSHVKEHAKLTVGFAYELSMAKVEEIQE